MSDVSVAQQVIAKVGLWWPSADEGGLRLAASAWRSFAAEVDGVGFEGSAAARALVGANSGPAVDAFEGFWARYDGGSGSYLPGIADGARAMAGALEQFAGAVADARRRVEELAVEVGATLVVGTALAIFTFGAAEAAAAGISAGLIASAASIGVELSATAAAIGGGVLAGAAFGAVEAAAVDVAVAQPIRVEGFHDGGFSLDEVEASLATGGVLGGLGGGAATAGRALRSTAALGRLTAADVRGLADVPFERGSAEWAIEVARRTGGRLTQRDALAIFDYTTDAGPEMNAFLRGSSRSPHRSGRDMARRIARSRKALQKMPAHSGNTFRGTDLPPEVLDRWRVGEVVRGPRLHKLIGGP